MLSDAFGNAVTTSRPQTIEALDVYAADWIGYGTRLRTIFAAADADPDCVFVNACAASVHMALEAKSGFEAAEPYLKRMRRECPGASPREWQFVAAVDAWARGDMTAALGHYRDLADRHPADIAAAKWGQYHAFNAGDFVTMRAIAQTILPAHRETAEAYGMLAFAEEQCLRFGAAEDAARQALALRPSDPWAHHALAHVFESTDRTGEAIRFLTGASAGWADRSVFIREHNWWHLAQFHLDNGNSSRALAIFDRHLWGIWPEFAQEQIGAVSALWRLELAGASTGNRWAPVAEKIAARGFEHVLPFHDMHFAYALARSGETALADSFLHSLERHAVAHRNGVWAMVAFPVAQALVAHARGDHARASMLLLPQLGQLHRLGGSHSQRDVLLQAWIVSASRARDNSAIEDVLAKHIRHRAQIGTIRRFIERQRHAGNAPRFLRAA
jgi:tetratricopeptide (TPR) repeat protein